MDLHSAVKRTEIMKSAGKWMELEDIILSEITHTQKDKYYVFSLICEFCIQIFRCECVIWNNH